MDITVIGGSSLCRCHLCCGVGCITSCHWLSFALSHLLSTCALSSHMLKLDRRPALLQALHDTSIISNISYLIQSLRILGWITAYTMAADRPGSTQWPYLSSSPGKALYLLWLGCLIRKGCMVKSAGTPQYAAIISTLYTLRA